MTSSIFKMLSLCFFFIHLLYKIFQIRNQHLNMDFETDKTMSIFVCQLLAPILNDITQMLHKREVPNNYLISQIWGVLRKAQSTLSLHVLNLCKAQPPKATKNESIYKYLINEFLYNVTFRLLHSLLEPKFWLSKYYTCFGKLTLISYLTIKAPIATAVDDKFWDIFPNFRQKQGMILHENRLPAEDSHKIS